MSTSKKKVHPLLQELRSALNGDIPKETVKVGKFEFLMEASTPEGEEWANARTSGETLAAALLSTKIPSVSVSLRAINSVPVEQLFEVPDDLDKNVREVIMTSPREMRLWRWGQIYDWLLTEASMAIIDELYKTYNALQKRQRDALKELPSF